MKRLAIVLALVAGALAGVPAAASGPEALPLGTGRVTVGAKTAALEAVWSWAPRSFADRAGLALLLKTGVDPKPLAEHTDRRLFRHRTYPVSGWGGGVTLGLAVTSDGRGRNVGDAVVRGKGLDCRARVEGQGLSVARLTGRCAGTEAPLEILYNAWSVDSPFQVPAAQLDRLGSAQPDWSRTAAWCRARTAEHPPACGAAALLRVTASPAGRQQDEALSGSWVHARNGGVLLWVPWSGVEEVLLLPSMPAPGGPRTVSAVVFRFVPDLVNGGARPPAGRPVTLAFDGAVFLLDEAGARRRIVPDQLVVTGIYARLVDDLAR